MYRRLQDIEELKRLVVNDKAAKGVGTTTLDRYPIRFVLFDNFRDCDAFIEYLQLERGVHVESVVNWIDGNYPDLMITHVELADRIIEHVKAMSPADCAIAPFSELARFYDNIHKKSFDALIKTIKAIQSSPEGFAMHQRVYIPIVGLEGKMEVFCNDSQINIWRLPSDDKDLTYRLILTDRNDFGVKGLETHYTVIRNIRKWLNIWHDSKQQSAPHIICMSRSIFANAQYAQPDNAFSFEACHDAYEFLVNGLQLSLGGIQRAASDGDNWTKLAQEIDISKGFNFAKFVNTHFEVDDISDYKDFIRLWFSHPAIFDRWLLARYYASKPEANGYIRDILEKTTHYGGNELIENMIAQMSGVDSEMEVRRYCLGYAGKHHVHLSDAIESLNSHRLQAMADKVGYNGALKYFSGISDIEKDILINWLGNGYITPNAISKLYPDLSNYMSEGVGVATNVPSWFEDYFKAYKKAKLSNLYTDEISTIIKEINGSEAAFDAWYNSFSTTYTQLKDRGDIEKFFWIDGLGLDWVPLVKHIIAERNDQLIYLNEIKIARAQLPTKTENNKIDLQRLLPDGEELEKIGDLDELAHNTTNISPYVIKKEIDIVRSAIEEILDRFIGKKIAIISDHGLTYLSQLVPGNNMTGVKSDHSGRIATRLDNSNGVDSSYFRLEDGKTLCALKHNSLCAKVHSGQGCHGGCTPEETLVPIFIISNSPAPTNWTAELLTREVSGTNPKLRLSIKNLPTTDMPYVRYNDVRYGLHHINGDLFETDSLSLDNQETEITLVIGSVEQIFNIQVNTGVEENDLFGF